MKTALFHNFTSKPFTGFWDGKARTFKPGAKKYMPEFLARHFAKHLANQVLIEQGKDNYTSPKKPEEVPEFMNEFNKAFILEETDDDQDDIDIEIEVANKPKVKTIVDNKPPQIVNPPDGDDDDYEGKPEEE